ncbi:hypothetical protein QFC21_002334 [Naganishia friedmannii]|uniref:Uncharacterized protein n=1 Tax=Naganishia friedmannii TaxID=89922 RepID=A0ACC2VYC7_9TREE|nr:hypothetical protein QFC21_002334 [Naganishia friedmannii]
MSTPADRQKGFVVDATPRFELAAPTRQGSDELIATESTCPVPFNAQLPPPVPMSRWQDYSSSTCLRPDFHMSTSRSSEASPFGDKARHDRQDHVRQAGDATLDLQRTMSMPSALSDFPALSLRPVYQPATPSNIFSLESPFSFMPTSSEQSPIDDSPHRASVSLPSSSGGLDALLNPPRAASSSLTHPKHAIPYYESGRSHVFQNTGERVPGSADPYPRRASSPDTAARRSPISPYPFTFMPLIGTGTSYSAVPLSNVDPKKARIEAEKGRREELRERFASLRDALPMEGQKASKINILDRAVLQEQEIQLSALRHELEDKK